MSEVKQGTLLLGDIIEAKNPPKILLPQHFKLTICQLFSEKIQIVKPCPTKIWQPWYAIFGNPENQNLYS